MEHVVGIGRRAARGVRCVAGAAVIFLGTADLAAHAADTSSLSAASRRELATLQEHQDSWTSADIFSNRLPFAPSSTFARYVMWNEIALDSTAIDHTPPQPGSLRATYAQQFGPHRSSRAMAIVHIAMFEAVNAVTGTYRSYTGLPSAQGQDLSLDAAIIQAAHDTLLSLYSAQQSRLDALLAADLAHLTASPSEVAAGTALGARAAQAILALRANDGSQYTEQMVGTGPNDFHTTNAPGFWSPDPISNITLALGSLWGQVTPFVMTTGSQFRPPPPPALSSAEYAAAYRHTLVLGGDPRHGTPTIRTPEQTFIGRFWAYDGTPALCAPPRLYNMVARTVALQQGMSQVSEIARFLALVNTAMADAAISAWDTKWFYQEWRPVTAIRGADTQINPETLPYPNYYPLGAPDTNTSGPNFTPPFPAYPSGHATLGGALFQVFRTYWPDQTRFTIISDEYNGKNRDVNGTIRPLIPETFTSFTQAEYDNAESRIYNGIHWEFDATTGIAEGHQVADYVLAHAFQPVTQSPAE